MKKAAKRGATQQKKALKTEALKAFSDPDVETELAPNFWRNRPERPERPVTASSTGVEARTLRVRRI